MRLFIVLALTGLLVGCGATPVFLGDSEDGAAFIVRLTEFRGETAAPGILRAIGTDRGVRAQGYQLSMRGEPPRGVVTSLRVGDSFVEIIPEREP